jgi:hypothetical protein
MNRVKELDKRDPAGLHERMNRVKELDKRDPCNNSHTEHLLFNSISTQSARIKFENNSCNVRAGRGTHKSGARHHELYIRKAYLLIAADHDTLFKHYTAS